MRITIIADGSTTLGAGHQVRMATLARVLLMRGHAVELRCRDLPGAGWPWAWRDLPNRRWPPHVPPEAMADGDPGDWLIIDHYGIAGFRDLARSARLLVVDDVPSRDCTAASLVLNQNPAVTASEYPVPALVGPTYALVRPAFAEIRHEGCTGILVLLGATDARGMAPRVVALLRQAFPTQELHLVGGAFPGMPGTTVHRAIDAPALARLMAQCRHGVLAAGSAVFEAMTVGMPFVAIQVADNQGRIARGLVDQGMAPVLTPDDLPGIIPALAGLPATLPFRLDGQGAGRVAQAMEDHP